MGGNRDRPGVHLLCTDSRSFSEVAAIGNSESLTSDAGW